MFSYCELSMTGSQWLCPKSSTISVSKLEIVPTIICFLNWKQVCDMPTVSRPLPVTAIIYTQYTHNIITVVLHFFGNGVLAGPNQILGTNFVFDITVPITHCGSGMK